MTETRIGPELVETIDSITLGHYQIRACIGEGGFGEVFEAWDSKLCRSVAIKRIKRWPDAQPTSSLVREARLAASLQHAAFVKIHAMEDDGNSQSIVMELVPGSTLKHLIQAGGSDPQQAMDWVCQIAEAMQAAHDCGLIHGDLKPSNLIVEPGGKIRILDFGLAIKNDALATTSLGQVEQQGTIAYMAPERLHGAAPSAQSDVYALGVILYELLCGARPFASLGGLALAAAQVQTTSDRWDYPETMRPALVKLIRSMTARHPEQRLAGMAAVVTSIGMLAKPGGVDAPAREPRLAWWHALPPRARMAAGAALAVTLAASAAWQLAPYARSLQRAMTPYSAALEMKDGLAILKSYDRPGSLDRASQHFEQILAHNRDHAAAAAGLSMVHSMRYASDQDETWLQKGDAGAQQALMLDDQLALGHIAKGWVLDNQGRHQLALLEHERALSLDPMNYFAWHGKALVLRHMRHYQEAQAHAMAAIGHFPREQVFTNELGTLHYEQGDYRAAEQAFRRSIEIEPDTVIAYANLNAALLRQNRGDEALQVLQQGLQVRPSAKLYGNLGNALFLRGNYVAAVTAFENAVAPSTGAPGEYLNWANLADTLLWIPGRGEQARTAYDKAMRLLAPRLARAPNDVTLVSRMGLYAARTGDKANAQALMQRAVLLAPKSPDVHFRASLAYELLGNRANALEAIRKARQLGYPEKFIEAEPDLVSLRRDPSYPSP